MNLTAYATILLAFVTFLLALFTFYMAAQTHKMARNVTLIEGTRLSIEQNWRQLENWDEIWVPVAQHLDLTSEERKVRVGLLNHLNLLLLHYQTQTKGIGPLEKPDNDRLAPWIAKSKTAMSEVRNDPVGKRQLELLLGQEGEGFSKDFRDWMLDCEIIYKIDYEQPP